MNNKQIFVIALIIFVLFGFGTAAAASHPLVDHWGQTATSGASTFGSKWKHTDTTGTRYGLWGQSASSDGRGVYGYATSATGNYALGVYGLTDSSTGRGVHGYATKSSGDNYGVTGSTYSTNATASGIWGYSNRTTGSARGVQGTTTTPNGAGVYGSSSSTSNNGVGVYGYNAASSGTGSGVEGYNSSSSGWAGSFTSTGHGVYITSGSGKTGLIVLNGSKSAAVPTSDGDRLLYNEESTELWFTDYGFGQLADNRATIEIDSIFAETVNLEDAYHVFLQVYGDSDIYVSNRTPSQFEVLAKSNSVDANAEFSYRIVAKRIGFEDRRLEFAPWVEGENRHFTMPAPLLPPESD